MYHENHNVSWKSSCIMKIIQTIVIIIMMALQTTHHLLYLPSYLAAGVLLFEVENKVIRISRSSIITCSTFSPGSAAKRLAASSCSEPCHLLARVLAGSGSGSPLWWYYRWWGGGPSLVTISVPYKLFHSAFIPNLQSAFILYPERLGLDHWQQDSTMMLLPMLVRIIISSVGSSSVFHGLLHTYQGHFFKFFRF